MNPRKALVLVDGHHYMHALREALRHTEETLGYSMIAVVLLGKPGKLGTDESLSQLELPVMAASGNYTEAIAEACDKFRPEIVVDISGKPMLDLQERLKIACELLARGIFYTGADFMFSPAPSPDLPKAPTLAVLGAGKLVGKTAVCSFAAGEIAKSGKKPVIITMGRGGPTTPQLLRGDSIEMSAEFLLSEAKKGLHAAGDNYEEALITGLPTIGCFRAGGGLGGSAFYTTVGKGTGLANGLECDFQIFEGSGDIIPPVRLDARIVVAGTKLYPEINKSSFLRATLKSSDMIVITGCEEPLASAQEVGEFHGALVDLVRDVPVIRTILRPEPLGDISGREVIFVTSAPGAIVDKLTSHLEKTYGCEITGMTNALSDKGALKNELTTILEQVQPGKPVTLLTELKAASIQVAVPMALEAGMQVVFCSNVPRPAEGESESLSMEVLKIANEAIRRYAEKHPGETEIQNG